MTSLLVCVYVCFHLVKNGVCGHSKAKRNKELSVDQAKVWYIMVAYLRPYHHELAFILKLISRCHFVIQFSLVHCNDTQAITIFSIRLKSISVAFVCFFLSFSVWLHAFSMELEFSVLLVERQNVAMHERYHISTNTRKCFK